MRVKIQAIDQFVYFLVFVELNIGAFAKFSAQSEYFDSHGIP